MTTRLHSRRSHDKSFEWQPLGAHSPTIEHLSYSSKNLASLTEASPLKEEGISEVMAQQRTNLFSEMKRPALSHRSKSTGSVRSPGVLAPIDTHARRRAEQVGLASAEAAVALDARAEALIAGESPVGAKRRGSARGSATKARQAGEVPTLRIIEAPEDVGTLGRCRSLPVIDGSVDLSMSLSSDDGPHIVRRHSSDDPEVLADVLATKSSRKSKRVKEGSVATAQESFAASLADRLQACQTGTEEPDSCEASPTAKPVGAKTHRHRSSATTGYPRKGEGMLAVPDSPSHNKLVPPVPPEACTRPSSAYTISPVMAEKTMENTRQADLWNTGFDDNVKSCDGPCTVASKWDVPEEIYYAWGGDDNDWEDTIDGEPESKDADWGYAVLGTPACTPACTPAPTPRCELVF